MLLRRQTEAHRENLKSILGAPPEDAPLNAQVLEVVELEHYRREKVRYQVSPGDWGYAYLLIPNALREAGPAVFCHQLADHFL